MRKRAPVRRRRDHEQIRLRQIIRSLADGVVVVDRAGTIRFANPAAERLLDRWDHELVGSPFGFPILRSETEEIDIVARSGAVITAELRVVNIEWDNEPMKLVSIRDVTDRKRSMERERLLEAERRARIEVEAASHAKSEFLAIMSHELRTPLNAILGYAELLAVGLDGPLTEAQRARLARIQASGRHLLGLVDEVLDLAKIEAGRLAIDRFPGNALACAEAAIAQAQAQAVAHRVVLDGVTLAGEPPRFFGDEERVGQLLMNLISNAIKFTPSGGRIGVEVGTAPAPEGGASGLAAVNAWTFFRVTDTGIGIPEDRLSSIFDPFVQLDSGPTRQREGSGLGLTISRRLARLMGGDLTVRSRPNRGSAFTLWLPAPPPDSQRS